MQSDFELSCARTRELIAVPAFPLGVIRHAAQAGPNRKNGRRRRAAISAVLAGLSIVTAAAAAQLFGGVQISLNPSGTVHIYFDRMSKYPGPVRNPTQADIQAAARAMNFPVTLPKGLPKGTDAEGLMVAGPGAMHIAYNLPGAWRRSNHLLFVILANPKSVVPESAPAPHTKYSLQFGQTTGNGAVRWMVGEEEVIVLKSTITPAELAHFKAAMGARTLE
jgi:hypothetical protein